MKTSALIILDGLARNPTKEANAISLAKTPVLDNLISEEKYSLLETSGLHVGLPDKQMGNSEVGHLNIGAGRVVLQDLKRIDKAFETNEIINNNALREFCSNAKRLHLVGLCSHGGVHSSLEHCKKLLEVSKELGARDVFVHAITDGRDRSPGSCVQELSEIPSKHLATVIGRYYAMDRDNRSERTQLAFDLLCNAQGQQTDSIITTVIKRLEDGETDEFLKPLVVNKNGKIETGDSVLFFNFRADRMRQIVKKFITRNPILTFTEYDENFELPVVFAPQRIINHLGQVISNQGLKQYRLAETEKYPHVTYFFNGGEEEELPGEKRHVIPSPRDVATYDLKPEMSALGVKDAFISALNAKCYSLIVCNFANCDMVGHTGDLSATIKAVETVDTCLGEIIEHAKRQKTSLVITADHGNADQMVDYKTGKAHTYHTTYPVWCFAIHESGEQLRQVKTGSLRDIAPTVLNTLGIEKPKEMTGASLVSI